MGCLTATERVQFPLLSRSNPGRYVKDVEVDTDEDETPACTPPAQPRAEGEPLAARVPRKRRWEGEAEQSQQRDAAAPNRKRPLTELCSRSKQKARKLVLPASSAETARAAEGRNSPSSGEDVSARTVERSADLPAPKARTPSAEARRPSGQGRQHAAPTNVPTTDRCFASEQTQCEGTDEGRKEEARVPSAQALSAVADQTEGADLSGAGFSTALDILAGSSAAAAASEATQPNSRESPGNSVATEILNSEDKEDESSSEEQEEESVQGTPITALCEQVVPLLSLLAFLDETIKNLRLKNDALRGQLVILRKVQKAVHKMHEEKLEEAKKEWVKQREKLAEDLDYEQAQNRILLEELVRQADEELIRHLQSQCGELRAQCAEAEQQLVEIEVDAGVR
ncbi:hypothetical protein AXG93_700s1000 [Marchantia polymorpha subsp. ruderalis]|uniref:Uncharacterized protein n=1 Tax=Marchantia polymorpha subsp. ruderalis TaxID=1480154 RepID=A0A176WNI1_MARPO|nr:hypothetical protein AXG93_700s1000 [Marchantia polymorpha subsp. ruderalis]